MTDKQNVNDKKHMTDKAKMLDLFIKLMVPHEIDYDQNIDVHKIDYLNDKVYGVVFKFNEAGEFDTFEPYIID